MAVLSFHRVAPAPVRGGIDGSHLTGWKFVGAWLAMLVGSWVGMLAIAWALMIAGEAVVRWLA